jgi:type VI secretion system protein ImpH
VKAQALECVARRMEFVQAARLLCRRGSGRELVGGDADPAREAVRFRSDVSFAFPISDVVAIEPPEHADDPPELTLAFLGVATQASYGSLPLPYSALIHEQQRDKSSVLREFLDCFNHRLASLYFRAHAKSQPAVSAEVLDVDNFARALHGVLGLATGGLRERLSVPDEGLLGRAGLLAMRPLPAIVLEGVLRSYFRAPVAIDQFLPTWYELASEDRSRLGQAHATLGHDVALGARVRLHQHRFRVRMGPLSLEQYEALLPGEVGFAELFDLTRLATTAEQTFEIQLVLARQDVPPLTLGGGTRCRLGWSTWLPKPDRTDDAADAVFASETETATAAYQAARAHKSNAPEVAWR